MTTSSVSKEGADDDDAAADLRAPNKASEVKASVISLFALDWIR